MHSWFCTAAGFGWSVATAQPVMDPPDAPRLFSAEIIIIYVGGGIALLWLVWWMARSRRDPLARAPLRGNDFRFDTLLAAMCAYLVTAMLLLGAAHLFAGREPAGVTASGGEAPEIEPVSPTATGLVDAVAKAVTVAVCLVLAARQFHGGLGRFLWGRRRVVSDVGVALLVAVAAMALCPWIGQFTEVVIRAVAPDYVFLEHETITALRRPDQSIATIWMLRLGALLVAPIAEEVFFRGLLQTTLSSAIRSRWAAVAITSLAFAAVHALPHHWPALIVLSVLMGAAYERTGSLITPITIHMLFNGNTLFWDSLR
jgi:membrane protease YdiL (CAAX protease family)